MPDNIWYRDGTVAVTNGSATVAGTDTEFMSSVYPGDLFTIDESVFYEVLSVQDNVSFTLEREYEGSTDAAAEYTVIPLSPKRQLTVELANRVNALIERYRTALEIITEGGWEFDANGDMQIAGLVDRNVVPRGTGGAHLGSNLKRWGTLFANALNIGGQDMTPKSNPTAYAVPVAGADSKLADGWMPNTVARLVSPTLTGAPTAPTPATGDATGKIATTEFVDNEFADRSAITSTPEAIPVAGADGKLNDSWIPDTVARINSPAFTGTPTAPTPGTGDNSSKLATTAYVYNLMRDTSGFSGSVLLSGIGAPTIQGSAGDFYLDISTMTMYGPKVGSVWPAGVTLRGPGVPGVMAEDVGKYLQVQEDMSTAWVALDRQESAGASIGMIIALT